MAEKIRTLTQIARANLIAHDPADNALLFEQLGMPLAGTGVTIEQQIRRICATLHDAWIPLDSPHGLMTGADSRVIWQRGFIEQVSTGLAMLQIGQKDEAMEALAVADQSRDSSHRP